MNLSRYFGVTDFTILRNLNISFFVLLTLAFSISYPLLKALMDYYFNYFLLNDFIKIYLVTYFFYNFLVLIILSIQCKVYMKNLNIL